MNTECMCYSRESIVRLCEHQLSLFDTNPSIEHLVPEAAVEFLWIRLWGKKRKQRMVFN